MIKRYKSGETLQQIGTRYKISRERVRQILTKHGLKRDDGGQTKAVADRLAEGVRLYRDGVGIVDAARSSGTGQQRLAEAIDRLGIRRPIVYQYTQHGTVQRYGWGCRCRKCRKANTDYRRDLREAARA